MVSPWLKQNWIEASLVVAAVVTCAITGTTGVYFLDTGINFHYGWLLRNGYRPFTDIVTPLMPLCGVLTALGYRLFGVNYLSSVFVSCVLCAGGFLVISDNLKVVFNRWLASGLAYALILCSLGGLGVLYYNHLAMLFEAVILTYTARKVWGKESLPSSKSFDWPAALAWISVGLLFLTKLHLGLLLGAFCLLSELATAKGDWRPIGKHLLLCAALIAGFFLAMGISLGALWEGLSIPTRPNLGPSLLRYLEDAFTGPNRTFSEFSLVKGVFILSFLVFGIWSAVSPARRRANWKIIAWCFGIVALDWLHHATSPDISFRHFYFAFMLLALIALLHLLEKKKATLTLQLVGTGLLIAMLLFQVQYAFSGLRKGWSIEKENWVERPIKNNLRVERGYFQGVKMRDEDFQLTSAIQELAEARPGRFWFGLELEIFYSVTGTLPPRPWPLWFHTGVSIRKADFPKWKQAFIDAKIDTVVVSKGRAIELNYLDGLLDRDYKKVEIPKGLPILVFERR